MKKFIKNLLVVTFSVLMMTSCYTYQYSVGDGAPNPAAVVQAKNHYLIAGLVPVGTSSPEEMAKGAENYDVRVQHTFVDGLLNLITGGLYTPTTTTVRK